MFIREKPNKSGVISIQIIDKSSGKYRVVKIAGSSKHPLMVQVVLKEAKIQISCQLK